MSDSNSFLQATKHVAEAKAAVKRCENRQLELRNEAQNIPGKVEMAQAQVNGLETRLRQASSRVEILPDQRIDDVLPVLRTFVNEIKAADFDAQHANSLYEVALRQQTEAAIVLQKAEHGKTLKETEAANIFGQIETLVRDRIALKMVLEHAPPSRRSLSKSGDWMRRERNERSGRGSGKPAKLH